VSPERLAERDLRRGGADSRQDLALRLGPDVDVATVIAALTARYADGGINLFEFNGRWRSAPRLIWRRRFGLKRGRPEIGRAPRSNIAIIAYHQR